MSRTSVSIKYIYPDGYPKINIYFQWVAPRACVDHKLMTILTFKRSGSMPAQAAETCGCTGLQRPCIRPETTSIAWSIEITILVHRLAYSGDLAAGQLAVFQGASEASISEFIRAERATRKNSQLAAARRVALKMGRRLRCSSVTYRFRHAPSSRLAGGPF
jgi:hypothetical protein